MDLTLDQALQKGVEAHKAGKVQEADRYYTAILKANPKHPDANHNMGVLAVGVGKVDQALPFFKTALEANPKIAQFWLSYVDALIKLNRMDDAKSIFDKAKSHGAKGDGFDKLEQKLNTENLVTENPPENDIKVLADMFSQGLFQQVIEKASKLLINYPTSIIVHNMMGAAYRALGNFDLALKSYNRVIAVAPEIPEVHNNLGNVLADISNFQDALKAYEKAIYIKPDYAEALNNYGTVLRSQKNLKTAIIYHTKALDIDPNYAEANYNIGLAFHESGDLENAIVAYKKTISLKPDFAAAQCGLGSALKEQGQLTDAVLAYKKTILIDPQYAEAHFNIGVIFQEQENLEDAIQAYKYAISTNPNYAEAYNNLGATLNANGNSEAALAAYNKAISIKPDYADAHVNLSFVLLSSRRLKEGLEEHEWRWKTSKNLPNKRYFNQPEWDGKADLKDKKILIWSEQGIGDNIGWSSLLKFVASRAKKCIFECNEKLIPLLSRSFPTIDITQEDRSSDMVRDNIDFHIPISSLARCFLKELSHDAFPGAFLVPDPARVNLWKARLKPLGSGPFVGISWKSANSAANRMLNYAEITDLYPVLKVKGVTFINLQYADFVDDLSEIWDRFGVAVHNFQDLDHFNNLDDVAALAAALDLVVTTKTAVPLLSSGVGTKTFIAAWRQSPWNNILRNPLCSEVTIYERDTWESWERVFNLIADDLTKFKGIHDTDTDK